MFDLIFEFFKLKLKEREMWKECGKETESSQLLLLKFNRVNHESK